MLLADRAVVISARCFSSCAWNPKGADVRLEASRMTCISLEQLPFGLQISIEQLESDSQLQKSQILFIDLTEDGEIRGPWEL